MLPRESGLHAEEVIPSFREERLEQRKKKPAILIGVSIGVVIAVAVGWLTFGKYVSVYYGADSGELPVVRANSSADGVKPDTPGGMEVPDRDKLIYERLRQSNTSLPVERLLPSTEKPQKPVVEEVNPDDAIGALAQSIIAQEQLASAVIYEDDGTPVEVMFKETEVATVVAPVKTEPAKKEEKQDVKKEEEKKPQTQVQKQPVPAVATDFYAIQLVSARSDSAAESEWKRLSKKFRDIIADQPHMISKTVTASGTFYRLRIGQFKTHDEAKKMCDQLKLQKQECFVVK